MTEPYLTIAEIECRYPNEWVLLDGVKTDRQLRVKSGFILHHTPDRLEMDRWMVAIPDDGDVHHYACVWTGEMVLVGHLPRP